MTNPHQIEIRTDGAGDPAIIFHLYIDEDGFPELFLPMPGWIGCPELKGGADCLPFILFDTGTVNFGAYAPEDSRCGIIHWPRVDRYRVGVEVGVTLAGKEAAYKVFRISRV